MDEADWTINELGAALRGDERRTVSAPSGGFSLTTFARTTITG
jgi:hypothetical protein